MPDANGPIEVLCRYRVKSGQAEAFAEMLGRHWQTLHNAGLATDEPARLLRAGDKAGNVAFIETFSWKNEDAVQTAHESPEVMSLWEPMGSLCEDMEFWNVDVFDGSGA